ncbi:hypothetical protein BDZ85DRAFT_29952 [Elsinoe ampelina]|uniref:Uncharacterized protein n=1 Tax=Elsinoe ampelina TaxID=302913 RepID=A0A6A6G4K3_9PEZI|nr:hypothetical protein BDZ85DRAFT_29952 [Elsinoe ampelina]
MVRSRQREKTSAATACSRGQHSHRHTYKDLIFPTAHVPAAIPRQKLMKITVCGPSGRGRSTDGGLSRSQAGHSFLSCPRRATLQTPEATPDDLHSAASDSNFQWPILFVRYCLHPTQIAPTADQPRVQTSRINSSSHVTETRRMQLFKLEHSRSCRCCM